MTRLLTLLVLVLSPAFAQDRDKTIALLIPFNRPEPDAALFPEGGPVVIVPFAIESSKDPRDLVPAITSPSIRIKDRFVPVSGTTTSQPPPRSVPRWKVRQALRSLDLARRYAPVYGTGTGVK